MTVTPETAPLLSLLAADLHHALTVTLLGVSKDSTTVPMLHCVHVTKAGATLTFMATDRYVLVRYVLELDQEQAATPDFAALFNAARIKPAMALLKAKGLDHVTFGATGTEGLRANHELPGDPEPQASQFPNVARLIPERVEHTEDAPGIMYVNFEHFTRFTPAKLNARHLKDKTSSMRLQGAVAGKPMRLDYGDRITIATLTQRFQH